jgi:hypothetical protein
VADSTWRQNATTGEWQHLDDDGYWYASETGPNPVAVASTVDFDSTDASSGAQKYRSCRSCGSEFTEASGLTVCPDCGSDLGAAGPTFAHVPPSPTYGYPGGDATKKSHKGLWISIAAVVVIVIGITVFIVTKNTGTNGLPPGTSLSSFEHSTLTQVQSSGTNGFDTPSARSVSCVMPHTWATGNTFKCFAFNGHGNQVGEVDGTVLTPTGGDIWNSDNQWTPSG